ncbi:MAG: TM2 domain-containing protein [Spirulinaceae cyanobacterium RM2_2_10]|nr:TM2 domain-containing protein [Spirulinaceae cyanobacterium SM2_1_0]NJO20476.1 TM2 domain-containing protein [Spirulinaceae cyanobacterium RM2_2_10]
MVEPTVQDANSKKIAAGILAILLGTFGVHKFVLGYSSEGIVMLLVGLVAGVVTCGMATLVIWAIGLAEGIIYLTKTDEEFLNTYLLGKKGWF